MKDNLLAYFENLVIVINNKEKIVSLLIAHIYTPIQYLTRHYVFYVRALTFRIKNQNILNINVCWINCLPCKLVYHVGIWSNYNERQIYCCIGVFWIDQVLTRVIFYIRLHVLRKGLSGRLGVSFDIRIVYQGSIMQTRYYSNWLCYRRKIRRLVFARVTTSFVFFIQYYIK